MPMVHQAVVVQNSVLPDSSSVHPVDRVSGLVHLSPREPNVSTLLPAETLQALLGLARDLEAKITLLDQYQQSKAGEGAIQKAAPSFAEA